jgi:hypothetical protein
LPIHVSSDIDQYPNPLYISGAYPSGSLCLSSGIDSKDEIQNVPNVFPNPSNGIINIYLGEKDSQSILKIFDSIGNLIYSEIITPGPNNLKTLKLNVAEGLYLLQVRSQKKITCAKFLITNN